MVNRKAEEGQAAISQIKEESPDAAIEWKQCDLGSLGQVRSVFSELRDSLDRLDFLVLSAGINANVYELDADGIEHIFGVNYLGQYYATNQLWPLLVATSRIPGASPPRIVALSSEVHRAAPSDVKFNTIDDINNEALGPTQRYGRSKLALILLTKTLHEKVIKPSDSAIRVIAVHPGTVKTGMQDQWKAAYPGITGHLLSFAMKALGRDPEQGAYSSLWALTAPEIDEKNINAEYYTDPGTPGKESSQASDPQLGEALWKLSEHLVKDKLGNDALLSWRDQSQGLRK